MSQTANWTGNFDANQQYSYMVILEQLATAFNDSPFFVQNQFRMRVVDEQIECYCQMQSHLIGNVAYQILHGGVVATMLDSIGGVSAMAGLYHRALQQPEQYDFATTIKQASRLATLDMRVDYLAPGRGEWFVTRAEILRMGGKSCVMRMNVWNDQHVLIATGIASYSF